MYSIYWENDNCFKSFIARCSKSSMFACCKFCKQDLSVSLRGIIDILRHMGTQKYSKIDKARKIQLLVTRFPSISKATLPEK